MTAGSWRHWLKVDPEGHTGTRFNPSTFHGQHTRLHLSTKGPRSYGASSTPAPGTWFPRPSSSEGTRAPGREADSRPGEGNAKLVWRVVQRQPGRAQNKPSPIRMGLCQSSDTGEKLKVLTAAKVGTIGATEFIKSHHSVIQGMK